LIRLERERGNIYKRERKREVGERWERGRREVGERWERQREKSQHPQRAILTAR